MKSAIVIQPAGESMPAAELPLLFHGVGSRAEDVVPRMPARLGIEAHECLSSLGAMATLDRFAGLAHGIDGRVVDCLRHRLSTPTAGGAPS